REVTYRDIEVFKAIQPEELSSCGWAKKQKLNYAPHVVAFIRRFNHISFWVVREILNAKKLKTRVVVMSHFIKIAKKFFEMNNLHALKAIISGLQSVPVYRLDQTWENLIVISNNTQYTIVIIIVINIILIDMTSNLHHFFIQNLPKREHASFEKFVDLLSENENRIKLREYLSTVRLPCIPHLGMYLTDLTYVDTMHPSTGGMDKERTKKVIAKLYCIPYPQKMNDIIRIIAEFQQSDYGIIEPQPHIQDYLKSMNYIEELQKFLEDNNYRYANILFRVSLSLQIEPTINTDNYNNTRSRESLDAGCPAKTTTTAFVPGHRKVQSLGTNVMQTVVKSSLESLSLASSTSSRNLLDDSIVAMDGKDRESLVNERNSALSFERASGVYESDDSELCHPHSEFIIEGFLRRKKIFRNSKKLTVSSWQKFWVGLNESCLYYFLPKHRSVGKLEKTSFKGKPRKVVNIEDWIVHIKSDSHHTDCFELSDHIHGTSYKFRTGSQSAALMWYTYLSQATTGKNKIPQNLISFEESDETNDTRL
ncbi:hypothetical protein QZH41_015050, partial [Actinostola sp. cb2023]